MSITDPGSSKTTLQRFSVPETIEDIRDLQRRTTELRKAHLLRWAERKLCPPHLTPTERKAILGRFATSDDLIAAAGVASAGTARKQLAQGRHAFLQSRACSMSVWEWGAARYSTKGSWYAFRAAMQFFLVEKIGETKRTLDEWMRVSGRFGQAVPAALEAAAKQACQDLPKLAEQLAALPDGLPDAFKVHAAPQPEQFSVTNAHLGVPTPKRRRRSKSASLKRLPADWREQMAAKMRWPLQLHWLMQCVTGCRSEELKNGVTVTLCSDGRIETLVRGAKTGVHAGQPTRQMLVLAKDGVARRLAKLLEPGKPLTSRVESRDVEAYRKAVTYVGEKVFPKKLSHERVTPYSARNQFKADITKAGLSREQIAQAMGHSTTRSAVYYGRSVRSRGDGCVTPTAVRAARAVKLRAAVPQQVKQRKQSKAKAKSAGLQPLRGGRHRA